MIDENDAHENGEEPIAISENGEAVITSWEMWVNLCKNGIYPNSPISSIEFLNCNNSRDNYTMCSVQQEHQIGVHSRYGGLRIVPLII